MRLNPTLTVTCIIIYSTLLLLGCDSNTRTSKETTANTSDTATETSETTADASENEGCNVDMRPIVAAHGFLGSGDTFAYHSMRFAANGMCPNYFRAFDWNSTNQEADNAGALDAFIDRVLAETGQTQVDLWGHSAGGALGYSYLSTPKHAAKVAHYVHIGSFDQDGPAGPNGEIPTLNLRSTADRAVVQKNTEIEGATNVTLTVEDHYAVATSKASFEAIYAHLYDGAEPLVSDIEPQTPISISGRSVTLAENNVVSGDISIYAMDPATGQRVADQEPGLLQADKDGYFGPYAVQSDHPYELRLKPADGRRSVSYFTEPFVRTNELVYLRGLPTGGGIAGILTSLLPYSEDKAIIIIFSSSRALTAGRDSLKVDGLECLSVETAKPQDTSIAFFLYDADDDGITSGKPVELFASFPFLTAIDMNFDAKEGNTVEVVLNGSKLLIPARSSEKEGPAVVVFSPEDATCGAFCGKNVCGSDGCGGQCGVCDDDKVCTDGQCIAK